MQLVQHYINSYNKVFIMHYFTARPYHQTIDTVMLTTMTND